MRQILIVSIHFFGDKRDF